MRPTSRAWASTAPCSWSVSTADLGLVEPFDPRPYTRDWMLHRDDERYLGFLLARARLVEAPGLRRCRAVQDRALLRPWRHRDETAIRFRSVTPSRRPGSCSRTRSRARRNSPTACARRSSQATGRRVAAVADRGRGQRPRYRRFVMSWLGRNPNAKPDYTSLEIQTSASTLPIPIVWGQNKLAPNVLWFANFHAGPGSGGKGSGGKGGMFGGGVVVANLYLLRRPHHGALRRSDRSISAGSTRTSRSICALRTRARLLRRHDTAGDLALSRSALSLTMRSPTRARPTSGAPATISATPRASATTISRFSASCGGPASTAPTPTRRRSSMTS